MPTSRRRKPPARRIVRPPKTRYVHQELLPFLKDVDWKYRIRDRFAQNSIHFKGMVDKPTTAMIELGSHKQQPGGLMLDPHNVQYLASVFSLHPKLFSQTEDRHTSFFIPRRGEHLVRKLSDSTLPGAYTDIRRYLGLSPREIKKRIGKALSIEFVDKHGAPVMVFREYSRRASPPSQAMLHRWFIEFFPHPSSLKIAEAITEQNARRIGPRYKTWVKEKVK